MSDTIIDSLVVTLGLDDAKFKKGQKETQETLDKSRKASSKFSKEMEDNSKKMSAGIVKVRNEMLGFLGVLVGAKGLKDFVTNTVNQSASLGLLASNLSISTQKLKAFQQANVLAGGTAEGMTAQLKQSSDTIGKFRMGLIGEDASAMWFFRHGGTQDAFKSPEEYFLARSRIVANEFKKDPQQAALWAAQMGISNDAYQLAIKGRSGIAASVAAQMQSSSLTASQAAESLKAKQALQKLGFTAGDVSTQLLLRLMPSIDTLDDVLKRLSDYLESTKNSDHPFIGKATAVVMAAFGSETARHALNAGVKYNDPSLNAYADYVNKELGLPEGLLNRIKNKGERSNPNAISSAGAMGVMQFMPETWKKYGNGADPFDPKASIYAAGRYLKDALKRYNGNEAAAVAEYNGGIAAARSLMMGMVPSSRETQNYLARVEGWRGYGNSSAIVNVGKIDISTMATDAEGIARTIGPAIKQNAKAFQLNTAGSQ